MTPEQIIAGLHDLNTSGCDLASYARHDAVKTLLDNWQYALPCAVNGEGREPRAYLAYLLGDVADVIAQLQAFETAVRFHFGLPPQS